MRPNDKTALAEMVSKTLAFPNADRFEDLFETLSEDQSRVIDKTLRLSTWMTYRDRNKQHQSFFVAPKGYVIEYLQQHCIGGQGMYFQATYRTDDTVLITAQYDQIIGNRWLAFIRPSTMPTEKRDNDLVETVRSIGAGI